MVFPDVYKRQELGATTSIFPSDEVTREFLKAQGREEDWVALSSDEDAAYDEEYAIDLSSLRPAAAMPHSPDNVKAVEDIGKIKIDQVCIGSCTNSSYLDLMRVARILKGKTVHPDVSLSIAPGSKQVYNMLAKNEMCIRDRIGSGQLGHQGRGPQAGRSGKETYHYHEI